VSTCTFATRGRNLKRPTARWGEPCCSGSFRYLLRSLHRPPPLPEATDPFSTSPTASEAADTEVEELRTRNCSLLSVLSSCSSKLASTRFFNPRTSLPQAIPVLALDNLLACSFKTVPFKEKFCPSQVRCFQRRGLRL
jgi:hypothetical protein